MKSSMSNHRHYLNFNGISDQSSQVLKRLALGTGVVTLLLILIISLLLLNKNAELEKRESRGKFFSEIENSQLYPKDNIQSAVIYRATTGFINEDNENSLESYEFQENSEIFSPYEIDNFNSQDSAENTIKSVQMMYALLFDVGQSRLTRKQQNRLRHWVRQKLAGNQVVSIMVEGFSDYSGNRVINQALSELRAENVREIIETELQPEDPAIIVEGRGETNRFSPIASSENRRVIVSISLKPDNNEK